MNDCSVVKTPTRLGEQLKHCFFSHAAWNSLRDFQNFLTRAHDRAACLKKRFFVSHKRNLWLQNPVQAQITTPVKLCFSCKLLLTSTRGKNQIWISCFAQIQAAIQQFPSFDSNNWPHSHWVYSPSNNLFIEHLAFHDFVFNFPSFFRCNVCTTTTEKCFKVQRSVLALFHRFPCRMFYFSIPQR